jgi:chromosome partitioning protein
MKTIAFVTQKGGSGKSTLAMGLAVAAQQDGERVYMLETDKQGTVTNWGLRRTAEEPGIDHVSGGPELQKALKLLAAQGYTLAIIDTPGIDSVTVTAAIRASDLCLIPARPSPADIEAANPTLDSIRKLGRPFAFVLNQAPSRSFRLSEAASALNMWGVLAIPHVVQRNDHQDALGAGLAVTEYAPDGKAAEEIRSLWVWVKKRMNMKGSDYGQQRVAR